MKTEKIHLTNDIEVLKSAYEQLDEKIEALELEKKDTLHIKLLMEEAIGVVKQLATDFEADVWTEEYEDICSVKVVGSTKMNADKKYDMIALSKNRKNAMAVGFMGKIKDIIETGMLNYDSIMKLQQDFNGVAVNFGGMGACSDVSLATHLGASTGFMWSMDGYKDALNDGLKENDGMKAAWDELEKSIVANIANDVIVGVQKDKFEITLKYDIEGH